MIEASVRLIIVVTSLKLTSRIAPNHLPVTKPQPPPLPYEVSNLTKYGALRQNKRPYNTQIWLTAPVTVPWFPHVTHWTINHILTLPVAQWIRLCNAADWVTQEDSRWCWYLSFHPHTADHSFSAFSFVLCVSNLVRWAVVRFMWMWFIARLCMFACNHSTSRSHISSHPFPPNYKSS